uniref:Copia protein n=1 Tax=Cajanus cajan TaxID=3821 RepID=A0A151RVI2_CAJCA|nr:Copia protein [Cajanus cajan]
MSKSYVARSEKFGLRHKARNALMCALSEEEYTKVHSFKSAKQMWDTLALTYEGSLEVKRNKLSLLARKYELFEMEENESRQTMFGRFQTILNKLSFLGRTHDNFDHIDKLLRSLPRKWRPQVTTLRASKNLEKLSLEELIGLLKVHELEKIHSMMKKKGGIRWRKYRRPSREKAQPLCYECKKLGHYKMECPELEKEKEKEKKKFVPFKKKKAMMATWEDPDTTSSEEDKEANIYLMADADSSSESDNEEVTESDLKILEHAYNQLLSDLAKISTAYKEQKKRILELLEENRLLKNENTKLLSTSEEVIKLTKENDLLKSDLSKFTFGTKNLEHLLKHSKSEKDRTGLGFVESEFKAKTKTYASPLYGKNEHFMSECSHMHKKRDFKTSSTNTHGPKSIWLLKTKIVPVVDEEGSSSARANNWISKGRSKNQKLVQNSSTNRPIISNGAKNHGLSIVRRKLYRGMVGSLLYLTMSRLDIMFSVCVCARFQVRPKEVHLQAIKRILRYLKGTPNLGISFYRSHNFSLLGYCDADYAGDKWERKSTSEGCHFLGRCLASWTSKRQSTIALSTCEVEYVAAGQCLTQLLWIKHQLQDYDIYESSITVLCDNTATINISKNPVLRSRTKHIEIKHHFIRDHVQKGTFELIYVKTAEQLADIFTKPLQEDRYVWLRDRLGMELIDDH